MREEANLLTRGVEGKEIKTGLLYFAVFCRIKYSLLVQNKESQSTLQGKWHLRHAYSCQL